MNSFEKWLQDTGKSLGVGTALVEIACELGGIAVLIYRLVQMGEYKCKFKSVLESSVQDEHGVTQKSYYMICENSYIKDINLDNCHEYTDQESVDTAVNFINSFSNSYLYAIGIIWIFILLILGIIKIYFENLENEISLENKKIIFHVEGIEFLLSFVLGSLIIPINGINYQDQCGQNYFYIWFYSPGFMYYCTYFFLIAGLILYALIAGKDVINPIWVLILLPYIFVLLCWPKDEPNVQRTAEEQEQYENTQKVKFFIAFLIVVLYILTVIFCFACFVANSHPAMIVFIILNMAACLFGVYKKSNEIDEGDRRANQVHPQP